MYSIKEMIMAILRPTASLVGPSSKAPPTAPSGTPDATRLTWETSRCKLVGMYRLAPLMSDWSMPESSPPIEAKATSSQVKWRGSLKFRTGLKKPCLIGFWRSSSSSSAISSSISTPPSLAIFIASHSLMRRGPPVEYWRPPLVATDRLRPVASVKGPEVVLGETCSTSSLPSTYLPMGLPSRPRSLSEANGTDMMARLVNGQYQALRLEEAGEVGCK